MKYTNETRLPITTTGFRHQSTNEALEARLLKTVNGGGASEPDTAQFRNYQSNSGHHHQGVLATPQSGHLSNKTHRFQGAYRNTCVMLKARRLAAAIARGRISVAEMADSPRLTRLDSTSGSGCFWLEDHGSAYAPIL